MINTVSPDKSNNEMDNNYQEIVESALYKLKSNGSNENLDMQLENQIVTNFHKKDIFPKGSNIVDVDNVKSTITEDNHISEYQKSYILDSIGTEDYYKGMYVRYDPMNKKFIFKDKSNNFIGSFTVLELVRYIGSPYDIEKKFMRHIDDTSYNNAKPVIKNFVGYPEVNKNTKTVNLILLDYERSPFMGDIEMLIKLNTDISTFEQMELDNELKYVDEKYRDKIKASIRNFIYQLLNYTLKLISIISSQMKDSVLKSNLLEYSVAIVYRISQYVQEQYVIIHNQIHGLHKTLNNAVKLRQIIDNKINKISDHILKQSTQLDNVEKKIIKTEESQQEYILDRLTSIEQKIDYQVGGNNEDDSDTSEDNPEGYIIEEYGDAPVDASNYDVSMSGYLLTSSEE